MEYTLIWCCNRCEKYQNRLIRFKNDETVTGRKIQERKNKATFLCKYCNMSQTGKSLKKRPQVRFTQEGKQTGKINIDELRF